MSLSNSIRVKITIEYKMKNKMFIISDASNSFESIKKSLYDLMDTIGLEFPGTLQDKKLVLKFSIKEENNKVKRFEFKERYLHIEGTFNAELDSTYSDIIANNILITEDDVDNGKVSKDLFDYVESLGVWLSSHDKDYSKLENFKEQIIKYIIYDNNIRFYQFTQRSIDNYFDVIYVCEE